jgi:hypothetical protein
MVEREDAGAAIFAAGFDFAKRLRDPEFRTVLKRMGWQPGEHVVMAVDDEPVVDVIARMMLHEIGGRAFIAVPDRIPPSGYRFLVVEVAESDERPDPIELGPEASIGMLFAALHPCGTG